jgi:uncharacterized membrane protein YgdD (TMEM256/DUF423 family)
VDRLFPALGALFGALGVAAGAFGAHALRARLDPRSLELFRTAADYQMLHALALFAVAWAMGCHARWGGAAGGLFTAGILLFSGSLYGLALGGPRWLGGVTPLGGVAFLAGWTCLGLAVLARE